MRNERQEKHARAERLNAQIKELTSNEGTSGDRRTARRRSRRPLVRAISSIDAWPNSTRIQRRMEPHRIG